MYDLGRGKLTTNCFWFGTGHGDPYLSKTLPGATGQRSSILNIYIMYRYGVGVNMFVVCIGTMCGWGISGGVYSNNILPPPGGHTPL